MGLRNGVFQVYNVESKENLASGQVAKGAIYDICLGIHVNELICGDEYDNIIKISFDRKTKEAKHVWRTGESSIGGVRSVTLSQSRKFIAAGGNFKLVVVLSEHNGSMLQKLEHKTEGEVVQILWSPTDDFLLALSQRELYLIRREEKKMVFQDVKKSWVEKSNTFCTICADWERRLIYIGDSKGKIWQILIK